jgi:threonine dehydratase
MPTLDDVRAAADRLRGRAHVTPVLTSRTLDDRVGAHVFLKCELFQRVGAFKFRGACNAVATLSDAELRRGVITYSSGNHAQAVALAGRLFETAVTVVMPHDASPLKRLATEGYGAMVVGCEASERKAVATRLQAEHGSVMIPPFDDERVIAGQGTTALELLGETGPLDVVLAPCGGGGLLSGIAVAVKGLAPRCKVVGVEPETADDATRSFQTGTLQTVSNPPTIADGVRTPSLGALTFPLIRAHVDDMVTVSEEAIRDAMRFLFFRLKIVVEPSGVLGVAALLSGALAVTGRVGVVLSGGNIDPSVASEVLGEKYEVRSTK